MRGGTSAISQLSYKEMKAFAILTICFFGAANALNGKFDTSGGSSCKWNDRSYDGDIRSIFLDCNCIDKSGKPVEYTCEYYGNPSQCELFDKRGGSERFFHHIADHMKGKQSWLV